jgi:PII-like signaling protein
MINAESSILKIYASTTDRIGSKLLYEHIVNLARDKGISGVTV